MATLAPNLARALAAIKRAWPDLTVYWLGDAAHAAERSDHNPDARGIVHAIDAMAPAGTEAANAIVRAAVGRADLEYVIHNRQIWSRNSGWAPRAYTGSNPHTDHVHISGKHGSVGATAHTEAGYDVAAEQNTDPWVFALGQTGDDMQWNANPPAPVGARTPDTLLVDLWSGEQLDSSAYAPGSKTARQAQLDRIEAAAKSAGGGAVAATQDQVNAAMLAALQNPDVINALAAAVASHIHVS